MARGWGRRMGWLHSAAWGSCGPLAERERDCVGTGGTSNQLWDKHLQRNVPGTRHGAAGTPFEAVMCTVPDAECRFSIFRAKCSRAMKLAAGKSG
jgi:hypothetical protein